MTVVLALQPSDIDIERLYDDLYFPEGRDGVPYIVFNMVASVDGKVTIRGRSQPVGSRIDHALMRKIRAVADMVLVGAGTLRKENIDFRLAPHLQQRRVDRGLSRAPYAAVLSPSLDLPLNRTFFTSDEFESVVFTVRAAPRERIREIERFARILYVGEAEVDLKKMMSVAFVELGVRRMVVEGGPTLNQSLLQAGFGDELFFTIAPRLIGGREPTMVQGADLLVEHRRPLSLVSAYAFNDEMYLRYRL